MGKRTARIISYIATAILLTAIVVGVVFFINIPEKEDVEETFATVEVPVHETIILTMPGASKAPVSVDYGTLSVK